MVTDYHREYKKRWCREYYRKNKKRIAEQRKRYEASGCDSGIHNAGVLGKRGNPRKIKRLCRIYGFSKDASNIIAIDGQLLDDRIKELNKKHIENHR